MCFVPVFGIYSSDKTEALLFVKLPFWSFSTCLMSAWEAIFRLSYLIGSRQPVLARIMKVPFYTDVYALTQTAHCI